MKIIAPILLYTKYYFAEEIVLLFFLKPEYDTSADIFLYK